MHCLFLKGPGRGRKRLIKQYENKTLQQNKNNNKKESRHPPTPTPHPKLVWYGIALALHFPCVENEGGVASNKVKKIGFSVC